MQQTSTIAKQNISQKTQIDIDIVLDYDIIKVSYGTPRGGQVMQFNLLEAEMKRCGISIDDFCKAIGISRSKYYRAKNGLTEFSRQDIERSIEILGIRDPMAIFFADAVS